MARQYSIRDFFRQMPLGLIKRFFEIKGVLVEIDCAIPPGANSTDLFKAWMLLNAIQRNSIDAEFQVVFEMSCEKGFRAIIDEARWQLRNDQDALTSLIQNLATLDNHFERAMVTYLDYSHLWRGATRFYHADTLPYWRKRKNFSHKPASVDQVSINELANLIRNYFHHTEGRGNNCVVEPFRRGELDYFFAYPEDYSQHSIEWVNGTFGKRPHNPAFEVVFVYSQIEGFLDLNFRGSYKAVEPLQVMFANAILKLEDLPPDPKDKRVYDLSPLLRKNFNFTFAIGSGIEKVTVQKLRLSSRIKKGDRITLEADTSENKYALHDLLDKMKTTLPLHLFSITQAELAVTVTVDTERPSKVVKVRITHPNSSSLKYDDLDLKLRDMLSASGIEPRELSTTNETTDTASKQ